MCCIKYKVSHMGSENCSKNSNTEPMVFHPRALQLLAESARASSCGISGGCAARFEAGLERLDAAAAQRAAAGGDISPPVSHVRATRRHPDDHHPPPVKFK